MLLFTAVELTTLFYIARSIHTDKITQARADTTIQATPALPLLELTKSFSSGNYDRLYTTQSTVQKAASNFGYVDDDTIGYVYTAQVPGTVLFRRFVKNFPDGTWDHVYTSSQAEVDAITKIGYTEEQDPMYIFPSWLYGTVQLTRMVKTMPNGDYNHYFATSQAKISQALQNGYTIDGPAGYVFPADTSPQGFVAASCQSVSGWVCDADDFSLPVSIATTFNYIPQPYVTANRDFGSSIAPLCGGSTKHAFSIPIPTSAQNGQIQSIQAYGINIGLGNNAQLGGSPVNIKCGDTTISNVVNHILSTGQSLSWGADGTPPLTTTQPYNNLMLYQDSLYHYQSVFTPLIEYSVESMSSAMANAITASMGNNYVILNTKAGQVGYTYDQLKKGVVGPDGVNHYDVGLAEEKAAKQAADALHVQYKVTALTVIHGESDSMIGTSAYQYENDLAEWQRNYEADSKAISGQVDPVPLFTDQMSSYTAPGIGGLATSVIPLAQLAASEDYPGQIYLVTPKYFLIYTTNQPAAGVHLTNYSYRRLGEYYAKVYKKVVINHVPWKPLSPKAISIYGNVITVTFNVPNPPIRFDTTHVLPKITNGVNTYGFEYSDSSGNPPQITSVSITAPDTIKITLSANPTGSNRTLSYAYTGVAGSYAGANIAGSVHGNVQDSDPTLSQYVDNTSLSQFGSTLPNWLVQFSKPITSGYQIK